VAKKIFQNNLDNKKNVSTFSLIFNLPYYQRPAEKFKILQNTNWFST